MMRNEKGFALLTTLFMIVVMGSMLSAYMILSRTELQLAKSSRDSASGFNAAESGLNLRAEEIRKIFQEYGSPEGVSPNSVEDCGTGSEGSGDFACQSFTFKNGHSATTFVSEEAGNPLSTVLPPGEPFAGLNADEFRYTVSSVGRNVQESNEALLDLTFRSRVVPMFQFAIFFKEDLEFFNGATLSLNGPVHTNGDFYLAPQDGGISQLEGQITVGGQFFRGNKSASTCSGYTGTARIKDPLDWRNLPSCSGSRSEISDVDDWNDNIILDVEGVELPPIAEFAAFSDGAYWLKADLRLALRLRNDGTADTGASPTGIQVVDTDGNNISAATNALHNSSTCSGNFDGLAVGTKSPFAGYPNYLRLYRDSQHFGVSNKQRTLEIDMRNLLTCIHRNPIIMGSKPLDDTSEGGIVFHFTIDGPLSNNDHNNYSVRVSNAHRLDATWGSAPDPVGLTLVTDQGLIVWGDYNSSNWIPASLMGDSMWLLSNDWTDADSAQADPYYRDGSATTVEAAVVTGIARTGGANGPPGRDKGTDTNGGGVINFMRFNEWFRDYSGVPDFRYNGSIVSLGPPLHNDSPWGPFNYYSAPNRNWSFDERFNDPDQLPPMTPVFVYLKQELFVREYEL